MSISATSGRIAQNRLDAAGPVARILHLVAGKLEGEAQRISRVSALSSTTRMRRRASLADSDGRGRRPHSGAADGGQPDGEHAAPPVPSLPSLDRPAVQLDDPLDERESEAEPRPAPGQPRAPCTKRSNTRGNTSGAMPIPESRTQSTASPSDGLSVMSTVPAGRREPQRVADKIGDDLLPARLVDVGPHRLEIRLTWCRSTVRPLAASVSHCATRGLGQLQRVPGEHDLARGHARHVEEVIDEMGEMRILACNDLAGAALGFGGRVRDVEHVGGVGDGGERIARARGRAWRAASSLPSAGPLPLPTGRRARRPAVAPSDSGRRMVGQRHQRAPRRAPRTDAG